MTGEKLHVHDFEKLLSLGGAGFGFSFIQACISQLFITCDSCTLEALLQNNIELEFI